MVIEGPPLQPFFQWLPWSLLTWLAVLGSVALAALVLGGLVAAVCRGPRAALGTTRHAFADAVVDLLCISPRRVAALTRLAVKESIRRRVVVVFAVFILLLMFAGWFLDPGSTAPGRLYLSFVLTATSYLVLLLAMFLSAFSLPSDIRNRTLHTVVTKPVRSSEIVLGRILGFMAIGTVLLVVMGTISYFFVVGGLSHTHSLSADELARAEKLAKKVSAERADGGDPSTVEKFSTAPRHGHRHEVYIDMSEGQGRKETLLETKNGHWHKFSYQVSVEKSGDRTSAKIDYEVGPARGALIARVPVYGKLRFLNSRGLEAREGTNVGDEWTYRSYIAGGTSAAAIWSFEGIHPEDFPKGFPLEMTMGVFRSHKGKMDEGIPGSLLIRNPETGLTVEARIFVVKEFSVNVQSIPRRIPASNVRFLQKTRTPVGVEYARVEVPPESDVAKKLEFDLFEDLAADGKMEIWLRCMASAQYFGVAQPDLYLRASDASFALNFAKGYFGIWLQMLLLVGFGVMFSTFLSGPVAMIATLGALIGGLFSSFMVKLSTGALPGGGPTESFVRLTTQQSVSSPMDSSALTTVVQAADKVWNPVLRGMAYILPDFGKFSYADFVANGFDVSPNLILQQSVTALGFLIPVFVAGYFFLRAREVAK